MELLIKKLVKRLSRFQYPDQVPRWLSNFAQGIKTKFKEFSREIEKN